MAKKRQNVRYYPDGKMEQIRKFDGREFVKYSEFSKESQAEKHKKRYKDSGYYARITKDSVGDFTVWVTRIKKPKFRRLDEIVKKIRKHQKEKDYAWNHGLSQFGSVSDERAREMNYKFTKAQKNIEKLQKEAKQLTKSDKLHKYAKSLGILW